MAHGNNKIRFSNPLKNARALLSIVVSKFRGKDADLARAQILRKRKQRNSQ